MPEDRSPSPAAAQPAFDRATVRAMLDLFRVEGADFVHNRPNDYGVINLHLFTRPGDPFKRFAGEPGRGRFLTRTPEGDTFEERPDGTYRLNDKLVDYLLKELHRRAKKKASNV